MLAHNQGTLLNATRLASGLGVSAPTVSSYIGLLVDLLLELGGRHGNWAIEIKRSLAPKIDKGFHVALNDLKPAQAFVVYAGNERYPKGDGIEAISLRALARELANLP